jgi:transcriptional regulator with XRE-family HTH domain
MEGEDMATAGRHRHPGGRPAVYELSQFGERLKARLDSKGWSRNTLSERTGINASTLWRWMVGQASPPLDKVVEIAGKVGCEAADLIPKKAR